MNAGVVQMPSSQSIPMVMAGLGTGLAPLRGMVRDRMFAKGNGESVGDMVLFFGARYRANEFLYENEWLGMSLYYVFLYVLFLFYFE